MEYKLLSEAEIAAGVWVVHAWTLGLGVQL